MESVASRRNMRTGWSGGRLRCRPVTSCGFTGTPPTAAAPTVRWSPAGLSTSPTTRPPTATSGPPTTRRSARLCRSRAATGASASSVTSRVTPDRPLPREPEVGDPEEITGLVFRSPEALCAAVFDFLETRGSSRYDDAVTQLEHALQTAGLAESAGASDELIVAALLHDIGH